MENASKALVIAGAVLVSILIVATGVRVYNSTGKEASEQAKQASEEMWEGADLSMGGVESINVEPISKETSYIGCYANLDNDPEPEGIIYADLIESKSGQWRDGDGTFSYEAITTRLKDYYISDTGVVGTFGTEPRDVITVVSGSIGANRFYVMALEDFNKGTSYCWYDAAYSRITDHSTVTSGDFGSGAKNTATMIEKWNTSEYGKQNDNGTYKDVWGEIQGEVNKGWFVPSRGEWSAFVYNLGITTGNCSTYGLSDTCWASSLSTNSRAWLANFRTGYVYGYSVTNCSFVRLSVTF